MKFLLLHKILIAVLSLLTVAGVATVAVIVADNDGETKKESTETSDDEDEEKKSDVQDEEEDVVELTDDILKDIVTCYVKTARFGMNIEFDNSVSASEIPEEISEEYKRYYRISNFDTVEEGQALTTKYLSENVAQEFFNSDNYAYFESDGYLFAAAYDLGKTYLFYDLDSIEIAENDENSAYVVIDAFCIERWYYTYYETVKFKVEYQDGAWRMSEKPETTDEKAPAPTASENLVGM